MKRLAVLVLAAMPLFADVVIPENEKKPPPTDTATSTATTSTQSTEATPVAPVQPARRAWPVVWLSVVGVAMVILIAARRSRTRPAQ